MICPECEGKTKVVVSKSVELNVYRKRECKECGYTFYTEETEIDDNEALRFYYAEAQNRFRQKKAGEENG